MLRFVRKRARAEREFVCRQFLLVSFHRIKKNRTHNKSLRIHAWRGCRAVALKEDFKWNSLDGPLKVPGQLVSLPNRPEVGICESIFHSNVLFWVRRIREGREKSD